MNRAWVEINLDNIAHNIREMRRITNPSAEMMAVVKADGYGHGALETVRTMADCGIGRFAVATIHEGVEIRRTGIKSQILVLGYTSPEMAAESVKCDLTHTIYDQRCASALSDESVRNGVKTKVHVKIDTGMSRIGYLTNGQSLKEILSLRNMKGLLVEGIYTHFAKADNNDRSYTDIQFADFMKFCGELSAAGMEIPLRHSANSAATLRFPESHLDMVRCGITLYGLRPSTDTRIDAVELKPAMEFKARVVMVKEIPRGTQVSYGGTFTAARPTRLATISVGYADGFTRRFGDKAKILINGQFAPIAGTICMDMCMADITDVGGTVGIGDEAVLIGRQGDAVISADDVARATGTINYEVVCAVSRRIPRVYFEKGKIVKISNYLI